MSRVEGLPLDALVPIKDVNILIVQNVGRFVVEKNNENSGHRFIYKHVVNGLVGMTRERRPRRIYIIVIEVINNDDIPWSFITKVQNFLFVHVIYPSPPTHKLSSFKEVLEFQLCQANVAASKEFLTSSLLQRARFKAQMSLM